MRADMDALGILLTIIIILRPFLVLPRYVHINRGLFLLLTIKVT